MSVRVVESWNSRQFELNDRTATGVWRFLVQALNEIDEEAAVDLAVRDEAPLTWQGLWRQSLKADPQGGHWWSVEVPYALPEGGEGVDPDAPGGGGGGGGSPPPPPPSPPNETDPIGLEVSFSISGQPLKVYQSLHTLSSTAVTAPAPNFARAINVNADGKPEGVDILTPQFDLSVTKVFRTGLTWAYVKKLRDTCGHVNRGAWWVFGDAEVLFHGASGSTKEDGSVSVTFQFSLAKTENGEDGNGIDVRGDGLLLVPNKPGWYYLWVKYGEEVEAGRRVTKPQAAYVERVYPEANFNVLNLG